MILILFFLTVIIILTIYIRLTNQEISPQIIECRSPEELATEQQNLKAQQDDLETKKNNFFDNPDNHGYFLKVKLDNGNEIRSKVYSPRWDSGLDNKYYPCAVIVTSKNATIEALTQTFSQGYFLTDKDQAFPIRRIVDIKIEKEKYEL